MDKCEGCRTDLIFGSGLCFKAMNVGRYFLAAFPGVALLLVAIQSDLLDHRTIRGDQIIDSAKVAADRVDLRLEKFLKLTQFCASSPWLTQSLDLDAASAECGRFADLIDAWIVVIELGETHRQILNTNAAPDAVLPSYPRTAERPTLLALEEQSRITGKPLIANVFEGRVRQTGIITFGQFIRLADGRDAMVYAGTDVKVISALLADVDRLDQILLVVDPSHRIVARNWGIERFLFTKVPDWMTDILESGEAGFKLDLPGAAENDDILDVGYQPLQLAPGWMVFSKIPPTSHVFPIHLTGLPLLLGIVGILISGLTIVFLSKRDHSIKRIATVEASNREKSRLLASVAHDIRSPIVSLLGSLELARDTGTSIEGAENAAEGLLAFVDDILELSFLGSDQFKLTPSPVDLRQLVEEISIKLQAHARKKGLLLHLKISGTLAPVVNVDRLRLEQVLTNLLNNAIKFTESGSVTLYLDGKVQRSGALEITFKVSDTGIGIAPEHFNRIFREYGRLDRASFSREPGVGLGLPICQRILQAMGSHLLLSSVPGAGSTFFFKLLLPVSAHHTEIETSHLLSGVSILYAEDEPVIRRVTTRRLVEAGADVNEVVGGEEVLAALETREPDMLLLDLQMPGLDGVEVIERLKAGDKPCAFPIFVLTSHISGPKSAEARAAGANAIFTKPVQVAALAAAFSARRGDSGPNAPNIRQDVVDVNNSDRLIALSNFLSITKHLNAPDANKLLMEFETEVVSQISNLRAALDNEDVEQAEMIAHHCLGICRVMGASSLAQMLSSVEKKAAKGDITTVQSLMRDADKMLLRTLSQMRESLD